MQQINRKIVTKVGQDFVFAQWLCGQMFYSMMSKKEK